MYKYLDYLPEHIRSREFKELIALGIAVDLQVEDVNLEVKKVYENQVLSSADTEVIGRWEKILGMKSNPSLILEQRRMDVIAKLNARAPITVKSLKNIVQTMTGNECIIAVDYGNYDFDIILDRKGVIPLNLKNLVEQVDVMKPANMTYDVNVKYVKYLDITSKFTAKPTKMFFCNKLICSDKGYIVTNCFQ